MTINMCNIRIEQADVNRYNGWLLNVSFAWKAEGSDNKWVTENTEVSPNQIGIVNFRRENLWIQLGGLLPDRQSIESTALSLSYDTHAEVHIQDVLRVPMIRAHTRFPLSLKVSASARVYHDNAMLLPPALWFLYDKNMYMATGSQIIVDEAAPANPSKFNKPKAATRLHVGKDAILATKSLSSIGHHDKSVIVDDNAVAMYPEKRSGFGDVFRYEAADDGGAIRDDVDILKALRNI